MRLNFTGNPRGIQAVLLVLVLITLSLAYCHKAKAEDSTFFAGFGPVYSGGHRGAQGINVGLEYAPFELRIVTYGETVLHYGDADYFVGANLGACGTWVKGFRPLTIGWGACLFQHGDWIVGNETHVTYDGPRGYFTLQDPGVQLTAAISLRHLFTDHIYVELFHSSTGGSTDDNRGRNWLTLGARF
jgi:hypothetical protein